MVISAPWSQVSESHIRSGRGRHSLGRAIMYSLGGVVAVEVDEHGLAVLRSSGVANADWFRYPVITPPSQSPGTARSSTSGRRSETLIIGSRNRVLTLAALGPGLLWALPMRSVFE